MPKPPSCSLIISVYNQAPQLRLIFETVTRQSVKDFEIIIADDGSSDNVTDVISDYKKHHPDTDIKHLWHKDQGFLKTIILNRAFKAASSDYIIVIDGDMLLHNRFIENHLRYAHRDKVLCGYRGVKLGQVISRALISGERKFNQNPIPLVWETLRHRVREGTRGFVIHNRILRSIIARRSSRLPGCNFSTHRENLFKVNGMDESILIYGFEDLELGHRLQLIGVQITDVSRCCNTYHLHHHKKQSGDISDIKKNISNSNAKRCKNGLEKLENGSDINDFMPSSS